ARRAAKGKPPIGRDWTPVAALICLCLTFVFVLFILPAFILSIIGMKRNRDIDIPRFKMAKVVFIASSILLALLTLLIGLVLLIFVNLGDR
ncbi:MAG: hypothetical protein AAF828_13460, partial [Bacteroidota bacterium]